jgi:hypothetical protein
MTDMLAAEMNSVDPFQAVEWNWVEDICDHAALVREWEAHRLGLEEVILGRTLSDEEADAWRRWWLPSSRAFLHFQEFRKLTKASYKLFIGLPEAGAQDLLGERAGLEYLKPVNQPSRLVRFRPEYPPEPPSLWTTDCEREIGGPHVLRARLLCWCAAAESPTEFGFPGDFFIRLLTQPVWAVVQGDTVRADANVLSAIRGTASEILHLRMTRTEAPDDRTGERPVPPNGPAPPDLFWWNGHFVELTSDQWELVRFLWNRFGHVAHYDNAKTALGAEDLKDAAIESAASRTTTRFKKAGIPARLRVKSKYVFLQLGDD